MLSSLQSNPLLISSIISSNPSPTFPLAYCMICSLWFRFISLGLSSASEVVALFPSGALWLMLSIKWCSIGRSFYNSSLSDNKSYRNFLNYTSRRSSRVLCKLTPIKFTLNLQVWPNLPEFRNFVQTGLIKTCHQI
jgi:hypothetical protein